MFIFPHPIRYSPRAKRMQIKISPRAGVEIVVPAHKPPSIAAIHTFVAKHTNWIAEHAPRILAKNLAPEPLILPSQLRLLAIQETWTLEWIALAEPRLRLLTNPDKVLTVLGDIKQVKSCHVILLDWLKTTAYHHLGKCLRELALETKLDYSALTIRQNQTRWGSCSSAKKISLCCKLLFLPPALMRHVLLHELCHTRVMNHGRTFWRLLRSVDPNAMLHAEQLRKANKFIPSWLQGVV